MIYHYLSSQRINFKWNINFQFLILRSFRTSWDDKLKWLCKHIILPLCVSIFNFQFFIFNFFSTPPVASQLPPLRREAKPHKPLLTALCHCETSQKSWQSTNHWYLFIHKKTKRIHHLLPLCHCETSQKSWQSINHKTPTKK